MADDELLELETERTLSREDAAAWLHRVADALARHNDVEFVREGLRFVVDVPDQVTMEVEYELGEDESSLEIEITW